MKNGNKTLYEYLFGFRPTVANAEHNFERKGD